MKIVPLRPAGSHDAGPTELDFPLPVADPSVRPMHRECVLKGCSYRSRFLFAAGWVLAADLLLLILPKRNQHRRPLRLLRPKRRLPRSGKACRRKPPRSCPWFQNLKSGGIVPESIARRAQPP